MTTSNIFLTKRHAGWRWLSALLLLCLICSPLLPSPARAGAYEDFFLAARTDNAQAVRQLLERGMDPNTIEPTRGDTALMVALRENAMRVVQVLLEAPQLDLEAAAFNGDTALMLAAFTANVPAVDALLAKGAKVNKAGWTALHYAAAIGNNDIVQRLIERGAMLDAKSPNLTTPLMMAARGGHIWTVKLLHDSGADATLRNEQGLSAIDMAARYDHRDIVEGLTYRLRRAGKL